MTPVEARRAAAAQRSFERACVGFGFNSVAVPFSSEFTRLLYMISDIAVWFHDNPIRLQWLGQWSGYEPLANSAWFDRFAEVVERHRDEETARYQYTAEEAVVAFCGAVTAAHLYWRRTGYPDDYVERHMLMLVNVLRTEPDIARKSVVEALAMREINEQHP